MLQSYSKDPSRHCNRFCIAAPSVSLRTVANFIEFLSCAITEFSGRTPPIVAMDSPGQLSLQPHTIVFAIGQAFPSVSVDTSNFVAFLNFSVLYPARYFPPPSIRALRLMHTKRARFLRNASMFDLILDFYPAHAARLRRFFPAKAGHTFPVVVYSHCSPYRPVEEADYDICVVGSVSPRRRAIWKRISSAGYSLSPEHGQLEYLVPRSRITANVHMERYDNCESHRILSSLAFGRPVVTETIYGADEVTAWPGVISAPVSAIPARVSELLRDRAELGRLAREAYDFYWHEYWPTARQKWAAILGGIVQLACTKWDLYESRFSTGAASNWDCGERKA